MGWVTRNCKQRVGPADFETLCIYRFHKDREREARLNLRRFRERYCNMSGFVEDSHIS